MTTTTQPNGLAPSAGTYRLGGKGGRMVDAWQGIWNTLSTTEAQDATELAAAAAQRTGLKPISIISHLHRMAAEGYLVSEVRPVQVTVLRGGKEFQATRKRTFYRIATR
jgi:hypothetical protein